MKIGLVLALTTVVALGAVTAASARPNPKVVRLSGQVRSLEQRLHRAVAARNALEASLKHAHARNASLERQLAGVKRPLAFAEQQVQREVAWAHGDPHYSKGALTALSAMNYVVGHVSTGAYGYLELNGLPLPRPIPDVILLTQAGICGHAAITFAAIMQHFHYRLRSVQFYFKDPGPDSHIAVEVYYDGGWHYFDPTYGLFWTGPNGSILSMTTERTTGGTEHKDVASFTNVVEDPAFAGDDTAFETASTTRVVVGATSLG